MTVSVYTHVGIFPTQKRYRTSCSLSYTKSLTKLSAMSAMSATSTTRHEFYLLHGSWVWTTTFTVVLVNFPAKFPSTGNLSCMRIWPFSVVKGYSRPSFIIVIWWKVTRPRVTTVIFTLENWGLVTFHYTAVLLAPTQPHILGTGVLFWHHWILTVKFPTSNTTVKTSHRSLLWGLLRLLDWVKIGAS